tara:strand:- start:1375 stop:1785 length:411 start_codon:yes stop_codon:yes gene_type:complete
MLRIITAYLSTGLVFVVLDALWLSNMGGWYRRALGDAMAADFRLVPAIVFYLLFLAGLLIFAVMPALASGRLGTALLWGALYGFFTYMTYDLTNHSVMVQWPLKVAVVDIIWGTVLAAGSATFGTLIARSVLERLG